MQSAAETKRPVCATELYHVPLLRPEYVIGDFKIPLRPGLLSSVQDLERQLNATPTKIVRLLGESFHVITKDITLIKKLVVASAQVEWYQAKGSVAPTKVLEYYNKTLQEANTVSEEIIVTSETSPSGDTTVIASDKTPRAGTRPYCRSLIQGGETNEQVLLEAVHAKFPEKASVFKMADVKGCLRNAGVIAWTKRKGSKKAAAEQV